MLLLKKKKYAAVKVQFKDGTTYEVHLKYFSMICGTLLLLEISLLDTRGHDAAVHLSPRYADNENAPLFAEIATLNLQI